MIIINWLLKDTKLMIFIKRQLLQQNLLKISIRFSNKPSKV